MRNNWCWAVAFLGLVILLGASATAATIEVSQPVQVTTSDRYDRNPSVFKKDGTIWVFFVRATSAGSHDPDDGYNPDADTYDVYYTTSTDNGATWSAPTKVVNASTGQRGMAAFVDNTGKIWVFVSAPGATDIKYTTSADNGATWSPLTDTGFAGSHVDAFQASDGKIWVFYEDGGTGIEAIKSADGGATWTHVTNIGPSPNDGIPKAMEADGKIYVVWCNWNVGGKAWYTSSTDGLTGEAWAAPTELVDVPGTIMCDPVMIKRGTQYILFYAPWDQGTDAQWLEVITSTDLANWTERRRVTNGGYGTTYWWDMWPEVLLGSDTLYLFYGSEKHGTERGDGNIFMYQVDWDLTHDHFEAIQPAIDFATAGDTLLVHDGTYGENLVVDKSLSLQAASSPVLDGEGIGGTGITINADDVRVSGFTIQNYETGIRIQGGTGVFLTHNDIRDNVGGEPLVTTGIHVDQAAGNAARYNNIIGNETGILNEDDNRFDARNNWWGDPSGPFHPLLNPAGTGDEVSDNVDFEPWLIEEGGTPTTDAHAEEIDGSGTIDADDTPEGMGDVDIDATGEHTITVAKYDTNPGGHPCLLYTSPSPRD